MIADLALLHLYHEGAKLAQVLGEDQDFGHLLGLILVWDASQLACERRHRRNHVTISVPDRHKHAQFHVEHCHPHHHHHHHHHPKGT